MNAKKNFKKIKTSPKIRVFAILLFLAAVYWFFTSLSEKYTYLTSFSINYTNIPGNLLFQNTPNKNINVQIEASGFEILGHKMNTKRLEFDLSKFSSSGNYKYYYLPNNKKHVLQKQLKDIKLVHFIQDSLIVYLGNLKTKRVPVQADVALNFKPGFKLTEELQIEPDSISIKGPEKNVDSIHFIKTIATEQNDIDSDINLDIDLLIPSNTKEEMTYETDKVTVLGSVAKYTEGTMELPIRLPLLPEGVKMELYPKVATVKFEVSFDNYQKIDTTSFKLTCKYPNDSINKDETLELFLSKKPSFVKDYNIEPQKVTYLIQQLNSN